MSRTRVSGVDIAGIALGIVVIAIVIGSVVLLARGRLFSFQWAGPDPKQFWHDRPFQHGGLREEKDEQVTGAFTTIEIRNIAGEIDIHGGSQDGVQIHSVKTAMFPAAMENLTVAVENQGSKLLIEERHDAGFFMSAGTVSFTITLPKGIKAIQAHSVSGSITVRNVPPGIDQNLTTISGSISTDGARDLDASSTSGSVQFASAGDRLEVHSVSGSVQGRIEALGRGGSVNVRTVSGSVDVEAPTSLDAIISLRSVSGGVSCDLPLTAAQQGRNTLDGKIGSGSGRVEITTTSGPITIRKM
ncbi:MAG TPA: DUF4097 family beta strand repeat-containing protein [Spirochaetia bacterium]|nr:DUF4097 family beta strand repeat-containing protein [Spirochaetia bacterium]